MKNFWLEKRTENISADYRFVDSAIYKRLKKETAEFVHSLSDPSFDPLTIPGLIEWYLADEQG